MIIKKYFFVCMLFYSCHCFASQSAKSNIQLSQTTNFLDQKFRGRCLMAYTTISCIHRLFLLDTSQNEHTRLAHASIAQSILKNFDRFETTPMKETLEKMHHVFAGDIDTELAKMQKEFAELSQENFVHKHKAIILQIDPNLKTAYETLEKAQSQVTGKK